MSIIYQYYLYALNFAFDKHGTNFFFEQDARFEETIEQRCPYHCLMNLHKIPRIGSIKSTDFDQLRPLLFKPSHSKSP